MSKGTALNSEPLRPLSVRSVTRRQLVGGASGLAVVGVIPNIRSTSVAAHHVESKINVVLVNSDVDSTMLTDSFLEEIAAAINTQVRQDFAPIWHIDAEISAKVAGNEAPAGAWRILIKNGPQIGYTHDFVSTGAIPGTGRAQIEFTTEQDILTKAISHECLEMLCNPYWSKFHWLPSVNTAQGQVLYPQEICDPCKSSASGYHIGSILVSDFVTPAYYALESEAELLPPGTKYSYTGSVRFPRDITLDSNLDWVMTDSGTFWRATQTDTGIDFTDTNEIRDGWIVNDPCP